MRRLFLFLAGLALVVLMVVGVALRWATVDPVVRRAAVSLAMWERHAVLPAATVLKAKPVRLEHLGSYACRNLYGQRDAQRSRHATADALDVAGFLLAGGGRVAVIRHWSPGDAPEAVFLREIRNGACRSFDVVLGPDHNAAHRDHLHLDRGGGRLCR